MSGATYLLDKEYEAGASAVTKYRIVKRDTADGLVIIAAAVGDAMFGVAQHGAAIGARVRARLAGISEVELGGTVTQGELVTSDATGRAVAAAPTIGVNNRIIGVAMSSGVVGDIASVLVAPGQIQGS
ncbi:MAG: DUF2190 family protein [Candidatus Glassbacteria bacterium]|nr:DUF2190 family protein [Candidatus Glassbacteria bacterium]